jgi:RecB family endonuclease NucS
MRQYTAERMLTELFDCNTFEKFFVKVSKIKLAIREKEEFDDLYLAIESMRLLYKFDLTACIYLKDSVMSERVMRLLGTSNNDLKEKEMSDYIVDNFTKIFPNYTFVKREVPVEPIGRIDILAKDTNTDKPVIMELKIKKKNPNTQLLAYGKNYKNPILIGITEDELDKKKKLSNITYMHFSQIKSMCD